MSRSIDSCVRFALLLTVACVSQAASKIEASELLIVDRLSNAVDRYSSTGQFLGTLISDSTNLNQPDGIALSPDHTKLFVASSQNNEVVEYNYDAATGTAGDPTVFATAAQGLAFPNSMVFSPDGTKLYVANLGGTGVTQLNLDGTSAGPNITGGSSSEFSGLAFTSSGELLAGGFDGGTVAISNPAVSSFSDLVTPTSSLQGLAGVLVNGNDLYVTGLFSGTFEKFNLATGNVDPTFTQATGLGFPQGVFLAPDGNSLLVEVLGFANGAGNISEYSFNGAFLGTFATPATSASQGFIEATTMIVVPGPTGSVLTGDVNHDGIVNSQDLALVSSQWLQSGPSLQGDVNGDGIVNSQDLALISSNWLHSSSASATAVPEPSTLVLGLAGCALLIARCAYRRRG